MIFELVDPDNVDPELLCPLCKNVWENPVELDPCGDIFCTSCLQIERIRQQEPNGGNGLLHCPTCSAPVEQEKPPNRVLVNVASEVQVRCSECQWTGSRGTASKHSCDRKAQLLPPNHGAGSTAISGSSSPMLTTSSSTGSPWLGGGGGGGAGRAELRPPQPPGPTTSGGAPFPRGAQGSLGASSQYGNSNAPSANTGTSLRPLRRAQDDNTESALLRNFQDIENEGDFDAYSFLPPLRTGGGGGSNSTAWGSLGDYGANANPSNQGSGGGVNVGSRGAGGASGVDSLGTTYNSLSLPSIAGPPHAPSTGGLSGNYPPPAGAAADYGGNYPNNNTNATYNSSSGGGGGGGGGDPWRAADLPREEYDQLMRVFMQFDEELTDKLTLGQFQALARYLNYVNNDEDGAHLFEEVDATRKGYITFDDFCRWRRNNEPPRDVLYGMTVLQYTDTILKFRSVDPLITGFIPWPAFRELCLSTGLADTEPQARQMFAHCDETHSGYVTLHQFLKLRQLLNSGAMVPVVGVSSSTLPAPGYVSSPVTSGSGSGNRSSPMTVTPSSTGHSVVGGRSTNGPTNNSSSGGYNGYRTVGRGSGGVPVGSGGGRPTALTPGSPRPPPQQQQQQQHATTPTSGAGRLKKPQVVRLNANQSGGSGDGDCSVM